MTPEEIVLIFALPGSAKVALDLLISPFKRKPEKTNDQEFLAVAHTLCHKGSVTEPLLFSSSARAPAQPFFFLKANPS